MTTLPVPLSLNGSGSLTLPSETLERSFRARAFRFLLHLSLFVVCSLLSVLIAFHGYVAWNLAHPQVSRLSSNPLSAKNLEYSDISFASSDGTATMSGWWVPAAESKRTVVLSHGYGANREESWVPMYDLAEMLHGQQYNVLMFDYGFASEKHRYPATGGRLESRQLLGAIHYAREQGSEEVVVWGFSMGAGTALQAALQHAPVDAMILDSTFLPDGDTIYRNIREQVRLPKEVSLPLLRLLFPLLTGTRLEQIPSAQVQKTAFDFPIFLIHGTEDAKAPTYLSENVAKSQQHPDSSLWIVPGAQHEMIFRSYPQEYIARTSAFLAKAHTDFQIKVATISRV